MKGKRREIIYNPRFALLIRENNYVTAKTFMNPRLQLLVRCVTEKNQNGRDRPEKGLKQKVICCTFIQVQLPDFLQQQNHYTIPLRLSNKENMLGTDILNLMHKYNIIQ